MAYRCWCVLCDFREEVESPNEAFDVVEQHIDDFGASHSVEFELLE